MKLRIRFFPGALLTLTLAASGCQLDLQDPNRPTEDEVFGSLDGIRAVAIGLQGEYANEIVDPIYVQGLITEELGAASATFQSYKDADAGTLLDSSTDPSFGPWAGQFEVVKLADDLLRVVPTSGFGPGTKSGLIALAKLYKGMAIGNLIQLYERIPLDGSVANPTPQFADRPTAVSLVLQLLQEARSEIQTTPASDAFRTQILAPGFDLQNTINAMLARYALIAGDYPLALSAAQAVNLNTTSFFQYEDNDPNPLWSMWYSSGNAFQLRPEQRFRLEAESGDQRVAFWIVPDSIVGANARLDDLKRYRARGDDLPVYIPDEMRLIQAEVYARTGQLEQARTLINAVRTQCATTLAGDPVACLPAVSAAQLATQEAVLTEILRQRRYELFLQGLRYSDLRRFGRTLPFAWIPIPQAECDRNPNAGC